MKSVLLVWLSKLSQDNISLRHAFRDAAIYIKQYFFKLLCKPETDRRNIQNFLAL